MTTYETSNTVDTQIWSLIWKRLGSTGLRLDPWQVASNDNYNLAIIWLDTHLGF